MNTEIITVTEGPILRLRVEHPEMEAIGVALEALEVLTDRLGDWERDQLSLRLFHWCNKTLGGSWTLEQLKARIQKLVEKKLINPINFQSLVQPLLDEDQFVWEEAMYRQYSEEFTLSPFTSAPLCARAHEFAIAIIGWIRSLPNSIRPADWAPTVVSCGPLTPVERVMYTLNPKFAVDIREKKAYAKVLKIQTKALQTQRAEVEAEIARLTAAAKVEAQKQAQTISTNLTVMQNSHRQQMESLNTRLRDIEGRLQNTQTNLASANETIKDQNERISALHLTMAHQEKECRKAVKKAKKRRFGVF